MSKKHIAAVDSPQVIYRHGAALLFGLHERFPLESLANMLDECVAATGETGVDEQLKEFWLTRQVTDVSKEQIAAIARTSRPDVQARIELIARGFLSAPAHKQRAKVVRVVKPTHRCPRCWPTSGGKIGKRRWQRQVNGPAVQRCYRCDQPDCPCEWIVDCRAEDGDGVEFITEKIIEVRNGGHAADDDE